MQHDAITKDSLCFRGNPSPVGINAYKRAYRDALDEQGLSWELAAEIKRKTAHCGSEPVPVNCDNTDIFNRIIDGLNLDDITVNSQGEIVNNSESRRRERAGIMADLTMRRLGLHDEFERGTAKNALALQALNIKNELADIRQTFDCSRPQSELEAIQRRYRALELKLQSIEVEML